MTFPFFSSDLFNLILCLALAAAVHFGVGRYHQYDRMQQNFMYYGILFAAVGIGLDFLINDLGRRILLIEQLRTNDVIQNLTRVSYLAVKLFIIAVLVRTFFALKKIRAQ